MASVLDSLTKADARGALVNSDVLHISAVSNFGLDTGTVLRRALKFDFRWIRAPESQGQGSLVEAVQIFSMLPASGSRNGSQIRCRQNAGTRLDPRDFLLSGSSFVPMKE